MKDRRPPENQFRFKERSVRFFHSAGSDRPTVCGTCAPSWFLLFLRNGGGGEASSIRTERRAMEIPKAVFSMNLFHRQESWFSRAFKRIDGYAFMCRKWSDIANKSEALPRVIDRCWIFSKNQSYFQREVYLNCKRYGSSKKKVSNQSWRIVFTTAGYLRFLNENKTNKNLVWIEEIVLWTNDERATWQL